MSAVIIGIVLILLCVVASITVYKMFSDYVQRVSDEFDKYDKKLKDIKLDLYNNGIAASSASINLREYFESELKDFTHNYHNHVNRTTEKYKQLEDSVREATNKLNNTIEDCILIPERIHALEECNRHYLENQQQYIKDADQLLEKYNNLELWLIKLEGAQNGK